MSEPTTPATGTATQSTVPVSTSGGYSVFENLVSGATSVLVARELAKASSGQQIANAATATPPQTTQPTESTILGMKPTTAAFVGGFVIVGLAALYITLKRR